MALTAAEMRPYLETDLTDQELTLLVNAAYASIADAHGAAGTITERRRGTSGRVLMLAHRASAITSIVEDDTELAADDYDLRPSGRQIERLSDGTNPASRWHGYVDLQYTNALADAERDRVAIALVQLDATYSPGVTGERLGDHQVTFAANNYEIERAAILASLDPDAAVVVF